MSDQQPRAVISALLFQKNADGLKLFLQTRWKPKASPQYLGMLEIPAGGIDSYENVYDALRREVKEETNLDIVRIVNDYQSAIFEPRAHDKAFVFRPYLCQQVLETNDGLPWIGFVFLCEVTGTVQMDTSEAKDPLWVTVEELQTILNRQPETIFPLQLPVLQHFVADANKMRIDDSTL